MRKENEGKERGREGGREGERERVGYYYLLKHTWLVGQVIRVKSN